MTTSKISFGPPHHEWHFDPSTKTYDLSGTSKKKATISTTQGVKDTSITIAPENTALVIVDMQNFFLDEKCMNHPNGLKAVEPTIKVIQKCREAGIQVIWLNWGLTDNDLSVLPASVQRGFLKNIINSTQGPYTGLGSDLGSGKGKVLCAGSWNADIYPALKSQVQDSDLHCPKNRMSGMWNAEQPLWKTLIRESKDTILFTGVNTDQCVLGALTDAYNAGWNCVLVDDCCGTTTVGGREVCLHNIASSYGFVTDSASLVGSKVG